MRHGILHSMMPPRGAPAGRLLRTVTAQANEETSAMSWTREQRNVTIAAYLGWTLDAFDFFLMVFVLKDIAAEFDSSIPAVAFALTLTLAMRPLGALIFGRLADRFGRRPTLMVNIACYSLIELASGFAPSLTALLVLRALFG